MALSLSDLPRTVAAEVRRLRSILQAPVPDPAAVQASVGELSEVIRWGPGHAKRSKGVSIPPTVFQRDGRGRPVRAIVAGVTEETEKLLAELAELDHIALAMDRAQRLAAVVLIDHFLAAIRAKAKAPGRPVKNAKLRDFIAHKVEKRPMGPKDLLDACRQRFPERKEEITLGVIRHILTALRKPASNKKRP